MFPYINRLHNILKDQDPFPLIRMPLDGERGPSGADGGGLQWRRAELQRGSGTADDAGRAGPAVRARLGMFHGPPGPVQESPINFVVSTTYTHINRTQAIHYEK